ncbi:hypothetical protein B0H14DRAFT_2293204, partial [Mycena olivaceomarginata]
RPGASSAYELLRHRLEAPCEAAQAADVDFVYADADAKMIEISLLPSNINEYQIGKLFRTNIGEVEKALVKYNREGGSTGVATVEFCEPGHAKNAVRWYSNWKLDG